MRNRRMRNIIAYVCCPSVCFLAVCGAAFISGTTFAVEQKGHEAMFDEALIFSSKDWHKVAAPDDSNTLSMLADQMQGNYERLRTWQGVYGVHLREYLPPKYAMALRKSDKAEASASEYGLWKESKFLLRFVIDLGTGSIYRSKETKETIFTKEESNEVVTIPMVAPVDERSVVTAEHYLHFDPKTVWPGFTYVPDYPETQGKRTAFRDTVKKSEGQLLGDLPDPRTLFGLSTAGIKFWEEFRLTSQGMKEDDNPPAVYEAPGQGGLWYRLEMRFMNRARKPIDVYMIANVSAAAGFNVVSYSLSRNAAGEHPTVKKLWQWQQYNGVFLPERVIELKFSRADGRLIYQREMKLQECNVNGIIAPSQFTYQGLGMKDGDVVMDKIEKACYIIKDGATRKLANFGEKYTPPAPSTSAHLPRWQVTICAGLLVLLTGMFVVRRYYRHKQRA